MAQTSVISRPAYIQSSLWARGSAVRPYFMLCRIILKSQTPMLMLMQDKSKTNGMTTLSIERGLLQGVDKTLGLLLHRLVLEELGIAGLGVVDTALSLVLTLPAP